MTCHVAAVEALCVRGAAQGVPARHVVVLRDANPRPEARDEAVAAVERRSSRRRESSIRGCARNADDATSGCKFRELRGSHVSVA